MVVAVGGFPVVAGEPSFVYSASATVVSTGTGVESLKLMSSPDIPVVSCAAVNTSVAVLTAVDVSEVLTVARVSPVSDMPAAADVPFASVLVFLNVYGVPDDSY